MSTILEHPQAQELLEAATVSPEQVSACSEQLASFLQRYLPLFPRSEQRQNATIVLNGKLSDLERKTSEPIANDAGVPRHRLQPFVGAGAWDDETLMAELRDHLVQEWADPNGVIIIDPSSFPKKGTQSCGVQRQWCGQLGKVENCTVGVFLFYACAKGHAPLDRRLFLPREWADDDDRRTKTHVPKEVVYQERWEIARDQLKRCKHVPHAWITGDNELGRVAEFRAWLREEGERYLLDVLDNTQIRDLDEPVGPASRKGLVKKPPWRSVKEWAERQPASAWQRFEVRAGEKGPLVVEAVMTRVQTRLEKRVGPQERLVVMRSVAAEPRVWYRMTNPEEVELAEAVRSGSERHRAEQVLQEGKGEVGLGQYEVRSWVGWHHHMTLSLLVLWFLALTRRRVGGEKDGADRLDATADHLPGAAAAGSFGRADRTTDQPRAAA